MQTLTNIFYEQLLKEPSCFIPIVDKSPLAGLKKEHVKCLCSSTIQTSPVFGHGPIAPKLMFIGFCPSKYDVETGTLFSDIPSQKIHGLIEYLSRSIPLNNSIYLTSLALCPLELDSEVVNVCSTRLYKEIEYVHPKHIILLGKEVADVLIPKAERLKKLLLKVDKYYPTYVTRNLREITFKRDEIKEEIKQDLDFIVEQLKNDEQNAKSSL